MQQPSGGRTTLAHLAFIIRRRMFMRWLRRNRDRLALIGVERHNLSERGRRAQRALALELANRLRSLQIGQPRPDDS